MPEDELCTLAVAGFHDFWRGPIHYQNFGTTIASGQAAIAFRLGVLCLGPPSPAGQVERCLSPKVCFAPLPTQAGAGGQRRQSNVSADVADAVAGGQRRSGAAPRPVGDEVTQQAVLRGRISGPGGGGGQSGPVATMGEANAAGA